MAVYQQVGEALLQPPARLAPARLSPARLALARVLTLVAVFVYRLPEARPHRAPARARWPCVANGRRGRISP